MGIEFNRQSRHVGILDPGTGTVKQSDPVTYTQPTGTEPTGAVKQQPAEVTVEDTTHTDKPKQVASQAEEPVETTDPGVEAAKKKLKRAEDKAVKQSEVEDKAEKPKRTKSTKKGS